MISPRIREDFMDDRLSKALEHANYATTVFQQKKILEQRFDNALMLASHGGIFKASRELIAFVDMLIQDGKNWDQIILAEKNVPIMIPDCEIFLANLKEIYTDALGEYYMDMEALRKARTVKAATGV
jgi:hypothetical protein